MVLAHVVYSVFTLYMMGIVLRWLGPWIGYDLTLSRMRWSCRIIDPMLDRMRRVLPPMGPMDFGPIATLLAVWVARTLLVRMLVGMGQPA
jgi:YggT family protein